MPWIHHFAASQSLKILGQGPGDPWSPVALEPGNVSKKGAVQITKKLGISINKTAASTLKST